MIGGRLFGETLAGRYAATDLIDNPIMLLEYIKRQQNWADNAGTALIKTGADLGSFDHTSLDELKLLTIARQITDESSMWTDSLSKAICETFYLVSRQDASGYECVDYLLRTETPSDSIDIGDIIPGSIGRVEPPKAEDIYVEPQLQYAYDYAGAKFTKNLQVTGIEDNTAWSAALTPGFSGDDGEAIWYTCRSNYVKYGRFNKMSTSLSQQHWIVDYTTALWKITKMLEWFSFSKFSFSLFYDTAKTWHCGMMIKIKFPNETNNGSIKFIIDSISKSKSKNSVAIGGKIIEAVPQNIYFTKYQQADGAETEWQATDGAETAYQEAG